jgi:hypothetical protein
VLAEGESEQIVLGHHLGEADVVSNERGDDANRAASLAKVCAALEVSYSKVRIMTISICCIANGEINAYRRQGART